MAGRIERLATFDFQSLNKLKSPAFDADRTEIMCAIYCMLWRDKIKPDVGCLFVAKIKYSGETLCTYKKAIESKYGKSFKSLSDENKENVRRILQGYGLGLENENYDNETGNIVNNHQLGNFMPISVITKNSAGKKIRSLNQSRAANGLFDYFDLFLLEVKKYYENELSLISTTLHDQFVANRQYFNKFNSFNDYIKGNFLDDFFAYQDDNGNYEGPTKLSEMDFEEYVIRAMEIILKRGKRILVQLQNA